MVRQVDPPAKMIRSSPRRISRISGDFLSLIENPHARYKSYHSVGKSSSNGGCQCDSLANTSTTTESWRRHLLESIANTSLIPALPSLRSLSLSPQNLSPMEMLKKIRPPKAFGFDEAYAKALYKSAKSAEPAEDESKLLNQLKVGQAKEVLEIGIGVGPYLKYYASAGMRVIGIDPVRQMEKYARAAAEAAGLPPSNFQFMNAVAECLPLSDASVDAVIGTQVLCSVKDLDRSLKEIKRVLKPGGKYLFMEHVAAKEGTVVRFNQNILNPLHRAVYLNCHLNRETLRHIKGAGFSSVKASMTCEKRGLIRHFVCGTAYKSGESH